MTALASFEDFLYIIIGILWIAFSFYNAKKKKDAKKKQPPTNKQKSMLESLLGEVGYDNDQEESVLYKKENNHVNTDPIAIKTEETTEVFSYDDYYEESNYKPKIDVIEKEKEPIIPNIEKDNNYSETQKNNTSKKGKKKINLRKAVIYSEIINKVYF